MEGLETLSKESQYNLMNSTVRTSFTLDRFAVHKSRQVLPVRFDITCQRFSRPNDHIKVKPMLDVEPEPTSSQ